MPVVQRRRRAARQQTTVRERAGLPSRRDPMWGMVQTYQQFVTSHGEGWRWGGRTSGKAFQCAITGQWADSGVSIVRGDEVLRVTYGAAVTFIGTDPEQFDVEEMTGTAPEYAEPFTADVIEMYRP